MPLHPVLLERLNAAVAPASPPPLTRRDARLPTVPGKVHAVIGMRRAGKTTFLRQLQAARTDPRTTRRLLVLTRDQAIPIGASGVSVQPAYESLLELTKIPLRTGRSSRATPVEWRSQ